MRTEREDILIGRVVDGEATGADWGELERLAAADDGVWARLAKAQRSQASLARAVDDEVVVAELVDLPAGEVVRGGHGWSEVSVRWRAYSGWAVAAAMALAWVGAARYGVWDGLGNSTRGLRQPAQIAGPGALGMDDLMQRYVEQGSAQGRVIAELPMVMVETGPAQGGDGVDVVYVRQLLERVRVRDVYELGMTEHGEPAPVLVAQPVSRRRL
ncbi:MAG: hypothetical protein AB7G17_06265 [Phycisphaerales bacterium]